MGPVAFEFLINEILCIMCINIDSIGVKYNIKVCKLRLLLKRSLIFIASPTVYVT